MKYLFLILTLVASLAALLFLAGCNSSDGQIGTVSASTEYYHVNGLNAGYGSDFRVVVIDGCQYLYEHGTYSSMLTHKGNCTNAIHQYNRVAEKP